jgi:hypothetical protein
MAILNFWVRTEGVGVDDRKEQKIGLDASVSEWRSAIP